MMVVRCRRPHRTLVPPLLEVVVAEAAGLVEEVPAFVEVQALSEVVTPKYLLPCRRHPKEEVMEHVQHYLSHPQLYPCVEYST